MGKFKQKSKKTVQAPAASAQAAVDPKAKKTLATLLEYAKTTPPKSEPTEEEKEYAKQVMKTYTFKTQQFDRQCVNDFNRIAYYKYNALLALPPKLRELAMQEDGQEIEPTPLPSWTLFNYKYDPAEYVPTLDAPFPEGDMPSWEQLQLLAEKYGKKS